MAFMVAQERARWLDLASPLASLKGRKFNSLPVAPKCLFSPVVATKQKCCEEKKHEGEAPQLCFPRRFPPPLSTAPWQMFPKLWPEQLIAFPDGSVLPKLADPGTEQTIGSQGFMGLKKTTPLLLM